MEEVKFILCDPKKDLTDAWRAKMRDLLAPEDASRFSVINGYLDEVKATFDCIVSVANAHGILDGSSDLVISDMFAKAVHRDVQDVIETVQRHLHDTWNGFQPVGTCEIVDMSAFLPNRYACRYIAHSPTMRTPMAVRWDKEVVYRCFWSILTAVKNWNARCTNDARKIRSVLCFGLATGVGRFPPDVCAAQMILAYKNFLAHERQGYKPIGWPEAYGEGMDIEETHRVRSMYL